MRANELFNLDEGRNDGGLAYEAAVLNAMSAAQVPGLEWQADTSAGFSNQGAGDIEAVYNGKAFNIEVKSGRKDQMGGTSIQANFDTGEYQIVDIESVDPAAIPFYIAAIKEKKEDFARWREHIMSIPPAEINQIPNTITFGSVTVDAWDSAVQKGLLRPLNKVEQFENVNAIIQHYNKKGVYYIQLGGAGLFHMGKDDIGLGVPPLEAAMQIEFRLGPAGSRPNKRFGVRTRSAGYRCQGRLKSKIKSPFTLDNPESIRTLFNQ